MDLVRKIGWGELSKTIKVLVLLGMFTSVFWFFFDLLFVILFQVYLVQIGLIKGSASILSIENPTMIFVGVVIVGLTRFCLLSAKSHISNIIYQQFLKDNRQKILESSLSNILSKKSYESTALFNEVIFQAGSFWQQLPFLASNILIIIFLSTYATWTFKEHFLLCTFLVVSIYAVFNIILGRMQKKNRNVVESSFRLSRFLIESLRNSFFFNVYRMKPVLFKESKKMLQDYFEIYSRHSLLLSLKNLLPQIIGFIIVSIYLNYLLSSGRMAGEYFLAFFYVFIRLAQQVGETISSLHLVRLNFDGWYHLRNWYSSMPEDKSDISEKENPSVKFSDLLSLNINNLTFNYEINSKPVFQNLNLSLERGDILHLQGKSGAGKSTLLSLILGINHNYQGIINYRGTNLKDLGIEYANDLAYVGPEAFFIEDSIRTNMLLGNCHAKSDAEILNSLASCAVKDEVLTKEYGLDTILTEHVQFSTGQKQRLSLARAFLRNPKLLILDESTANIDEKNESIIRDAIESYSKNCIVIIIAHKGKLVEICNKRLDLGINI